MIEFRFIWPCETSLLLRQSPLPSSPLFKAIHSNLGLTFKLEICSSFFAGYYWLRLTYLSNPLNSSESLAVSQCKFFISKGHKIVRWLSEGSNIRIRLDETIQASFFHLSPWISDDGFLNIGVVVTVSEFECLKVLEKKELLCLPRPDEQQDLSSFFAAVSCTETDDRPESDTLQALDCKIITKDKVFVWCHQLVLGKKSPFFHRRITSQSVSDVERDEIRVGYDCGTMKEVVQFIYTDKTSPDFENLHSFNDLLSAADAFQLPMLKQLCEWKLIERLSLANVVELLELALGYNLVLLRHMSINLAADNVASVSKLARIGQSLTEDRWLDISEVAEATHGVNRLLSHERCVMDAADNVVWSP